MSKETSKVKSCDYNNFKRARYFHGMLMTDRDFREEQIYHNEKRKLLNRMLHGWGVVCGLDIEWEAGKPVLTVKPGMALDCHGNEILVCEPVDINLSSLPCQATMPPKGTVEYCQQQDVVKDSTVFYIGIRYHEVPTDPVPVYAPGGGCEEKVCEYSRVREGFCVEVFDRKPCQPSQRAIKPSLLSRIFEKCEPTGSSAIISEGKARAVAGNTMLLDSNSSTVQGFYKGMRIEVISDTGYSQTRTIVDYEAVGKATVVDSPWDEGVNVPDGSRYIIRGSSSGSGNNQECQRKEVEGFSTEFCPQPLPCPECCPDEHFVIIGSFQLDANQKGIKSLSLDGGRSYVPTTHLFRYLFSSLASGLDTFFKVVKKDGTTETIPDVNLIHTNPIEALCWLGRVFTDDASIESREKMEKWLKKEQPSVTPQVDPEVIKLRKELEALKSVVGKMKKG